MTPNLVRYYIAAQQRVYNSTPTVPAHYIDRFVQLEGELMDKQISSKHYAEAQAIIWQPWVKKLNLEHLPLNIFLGIAAKTRYNKLLSTPSVQPILDRESELAAFSLMFERQYAEWYMGQLLYKVGIKDEHKALDTFLDTYDNEHLLYAWLDYSDNFGRIKLIRQVIDQFAQSWNITQVCTTYFALAGLYVERQAKLRRELRAIVKTVDMSSRKFIAASRKLDSVEAELARLRLGSLV